MARFDVAVLAARFQPPHLAHARALARAAAAAERVVVLCLGANASRSVSNPFPDVERTAMIRAALGGGAPFDLVSLQDICYDPQAWSAAVAGAVERVVGRGLRIVALADNGVPAATPGEPPLPAGWNRMASGEEAFAATEAALREHLLWPTRPADTQWLRDAAPAAVAAMIEAQDRNGEFEDLRDEAAFIAAFRESWAGAPYPPVFVTVDALVTWREEVLLIRRGRAPGKGLWALPGGFLDVTETLAASAVRELAEETGLSLDPDACAGCRVFDAPARSLRGRTVTHVFRFDIASAERPVVSGGDDAQDAQWWSRADLSPRWMFEDHYAIVEVMLGLHRG